MERKIKFTIVGISPIMTHNPASMMSNRPGGKTPGRNAASNIPSPEEEAERGLYVDEHGHFCFPSSAPRNAFVKAAGAFRGRWQKKRENLRALISNCQVFPELIPILGMDGKPLKNYVIDSRRVVVQRQGIIRSRPKFPEWKATFEMHYDQDLLHDEPENLEELFKAVYDDAGGRIGLCEYRPEKTGWFGRFKCAT